MTGRQVFEPEETVPHSSTTTTWILMNHLSYTDTPHCINIHRRCDRQTQSQTSYRRCSYR